MQQLLKNGANPNLKTARVDPNWPGATPLTMACQVANMDVLGLLLCAESIQIEIKEPNPKLSLKNPIS